MKPTAVRSGVTVSRNVLCLTPLSDAACADEAIRRRGRSLVRLQATMDTKEQGELTEAKAVARLMEEGYTVLEPRGEHTRYDLVVDSPDGMQKVQVKTAWKEGGCAVFNCQSTRSNMSESKDTPYTSQEVDVYVVYFPKQDQFYWVPFEDAPKKKMTLRVDEAELEQPSINYASDYRL